MKRKSIVLFLILIITLISIFSVIAFARSEEKKEKILTGETIEIEDISIEVSDLQYKKNSNSFDISIISEFDSEVKNDSNFDNIKYYQKGLDSITEAVIEKEGRKISFNYDTGEFLSYNAKENKKYSKTYKKEDEIRKIAIEIYNKISIKEEGYEIIELQQFDDEIWRAIFAKKYENLINRGESITISFSPESQEIVTLHKSNIKYDNNSIKISEQEARNIAYKSYNKNKINMKCDIEIVRPNYFFVLDEKTYKKINIYRKAYVFTLEDISKTKIYVDCTTGEIIGGNANL